MDGSPKCTDMLTIGSTGNGKSATGNSILGRQVFESRASTSSVTKGVQIEYSDIGGRIVKVVDGPGVCDTDLSQREALNFVIKAMQYAVAANPRGYHAILLVVPFGQRHTTENKQAVQLLKGIFGPNFVEQFTILVVTFGDRFNPAEENVGCFEEWCFLQKGEFRDLLSECRNRVVLFDNRTKDEGKQNAQRQRLFQLVDSLSERGERYTDRHFQVAEAERNRLMVAAAVPIVREESLMEASLILQQLGKVQLDEPEVQLGNLQRLQQRAERLVESLSAQDRGTGALQDVIANATRIKGVVDEQMRNTEAAIEMQAEKIRRQQEIERLRRNEQEAKEEELQRLRLQICELQRQNAANQDQLAVVVRQQEQTNLQRAQVEQEYHEVAERQNSSLWNVIATVITELGTLALRLIFRR